MYSNQNQLEIEAKGPKKKKRKKIRICYIYKILYIPLRNVYIKGKTEKMRMKSVENWLKKLQHIAKEN